MKNPILPVNSIMENKGSAEKEISALIVNYNAKEYVLRTLESVHRNMSGLDYEIIVADNASDDGSVESIKERYPEVRLIAFNYNAGYAKANNYLAKHASGRYLLFLNNDTFILKGSVEKLIEIKKRDLEYGIVAPLILNPDGSYQQSFGKDLNIFSELFLKLFAENWYCLYLKLKKEKMNRNVDWVSGACFLIERSLYEKVKGFDENFFLYVEDADLGRRIRQLGYKIHFSSESRIIHSRGISVSKYPQHILPIAKRSQLFYYSKHNSRLALGVLRIYLFLRFKLKLLIFYLKGDSKGCEVCREVIQVIREFSCEHYS
ncbi:MAG: glycosyltransferase family 2 protein [Candidatus Aminicenantaceae bacterium]